MRRADSAETTVILEGSGVAVRTDRPMTRIYTGCFLPLADLPPTASRLVEDRNCQVPHLQVEAGFGTATAMQC